MSKKLALSLLLLMLGLATTWEAVLEPQESAQEEQLRATSLDGLPLPH